MWVSLRTNTKSNCRDATEVFSSEQTESENEGLRWQHQRRIEAANQILQKQNLERKRLLHLDQLDTESQYQISIPEQN